MAFKPFLALLILLQMLTVDEPFPAAYLSKHTNKTQSQQKDSTIVRHGRAFILIHVYNIRNAQRIITPTNLLRLM